MKDDINSLTVFYKQVRLFIFRIFIDIIEIIYRELKREVNYERFIK